MKNENNASGICRLKESFMALSSLSHCGSAQCDIDNGWRLAEELQLGGCGCLAGVPGRE